jgi:hypothetical protein
MFDANWFIASQARSEHTYVEKNVCLKTEFQLYMTAI